MNSIEKAKAALEDSNSLLAAIGGEGWAQAQGQILDNNEAIAALASLPTVEPVDRDSVIEECAAMCEKSDRYRGEYFASQIRALKSAPVSQDDKRDAERYRAIKTMPKEMILFWMGAYGRDDAAIDAAIREGK